MAATAGVRGAAAQEAGPCAACVAVVITPGQALALPPVLNSLDVFVQFDTATAPAAAIALSEVAARGGRPGLLVSGLSTDPIPSAVLSTTALLLFDLSRAGGGATAEEQVFVLKTAATLGRAAAPRMQIGVMGAPAALRPLLVAGLHAYVDFIAWEGAPPAGVPPKPAWISAPGGIPVLSDVGAALEATRRSVAERWLYRVPREIDRAHTVLHALAAAARLLPAGLVAAGGAEVTCGGRPASSYLNPASLDTVAVARQCPPDALISTNPAEAGVERLTLPTGDAIIRVPAPAQSGRFAEGIDVLAPRHLTVEEVIARHQAAAARQAAAIRSSIATGSLTLTFEAPGFPAPVTISSNTTIYAAAGRTDLEQRAIRVNGVAFGGGVPRLPIIEPERVASPPLAIALTDAYRYRLAGRETVADVPCYVVAFEPIDRGRPLFRGKAWIAADTFAMVRVAAAQTGLRGPIVASEQVDAFSPQGDGLWLLARSDVRQTYEGAAHRTPIHRVLAIAHYDINPADFLLRRDAAYAARDNVMLRDTPAGYRYLQKPAASPSSQRPAVPGGPALAAPADRVRTLAAGVIVDPNITTPLPFAGVSYVDFNLFDTGTQFNAFFGGSYAQAAFSIPSVGGRAWQLAGRAFGIASSYHDRAFAGGRELYELNIRQRPAAASVWLMRRMGPRVSIRLGYDLEYTHFSAADSTHPGFVVPADQVTHGARLTLDAQRDGWNASVWWNPARRAGWKAWGLRGDEYDAAHHSFQRYGASLGRSAVLSPRLVVRVEGAAMAGHDLDRFSRYSFGTFDNRLRGYPAALIRFDRGAVLRTALAWAPGRLARLDIFGDTALVRDPGYGRSARNYTGIGTAIETPAPFGTLLSVEWGYGFRGVNADGGLGTHVFRISVFKVF